MAQNTDLIVAGTGKPGGYIFRAPEGTTVPATEAALLDAAFVNQGYASSDGLSRAIAKAYEIIRDWNGDEVKRLKTETSVTLTFTLIQAADAEVLRSKFGADAVTVSGDRITVSYKGEDAPASPWVFDLKDGNSVRRIVAANAQDVTEDFTQEMTAGTVIGIPFTLTLYKDASGAFFHDYSSTPSGGSSSSSSSSSS